MGRFHWRGTRKFGPFRMNFTEKGYSSTSYSIGPRNFRFTYNSRTDKWSLDLPGGFRYRFGDQPRGRGKSESNIAGWVVGFILTSGAAFVLIIVGVIAFWWLS